MSNLVDLKGNELIPARVALRNAIENSTEVPVTSHIAVDHRFYPLMGVADSAIATAARQHGFAVLTDDLRLYAELIEDRVAVINFTHVQEQSWA